MGCNERDTKSKLQPGPGGKLVVTVTRQAVESGKSVSLEKGIPFSFELNSLSNPSPRVGAKINIQKDFA